MKSIQIFFFFFCFFFNRHSIIVRPIYIILLNLQMHQKGNGIHGSNYEQGSSWAVEMGSHLKVCSIVVENLNKNGQMLVEVSIDHLCSFCRKQF